MIVQLLREHNLEFLTLKGACRGPCHIVGNLMHWLIFACVVVLRTHPAYMYRFGPPFKWRFAGGLMVVHYYTITCAGCDSKMCMSLDTISVTR